MKANSFWSQRRKSCTVSRCVRSGTSANAYLARRFSPRGNNGPIPVLYSSISLSLISSRLASFTLFGLPFRLEALSCSNSASCRVSHTSFTRECKSSRLCTVSSSGIEWKKNPYLSAANKHERKRHRGEPKYVPCDEYFLPRFEEAEVSLVLRSWLRIICPAFRDSGWKTFSLGFGLVAGLVGFVGAIVVADDLELWLLEVGNNDHKQEQPRKSNGNFFPVFCNIAVRGLATTKSVAMPFP
jgi:hypothetical protein